MATPAQTLPGQQQPDDPMAQQQGPPPQPGIEASTDNPQMETGDEAAAAVDLTPDEQKDLMEVRRLHKEQYLPKRNLFIRRALRAFEVLKNNPYILYNETTADYDSLAMILQGVASKKDIDLYQYQNNIYQMLGMAFIAALSVDVSKTRYQPVDPQNEEDILMAKKASTIHAFNERRNGNDALQQLELLYLWCTGSYFCYVRHIIDRNRAGVTPRPIMAMQNTPVLPDRYVCSQCGSVTPEDQVASFGKMSCPDCGQQFGPSDWRESASLPLPVKVGVEEVPNGMTAFNVYSGLNIDADPDACELYESLTLDLEVETNIAAIRAAYPKMYGQIQENMTGDGTTNGEIAKRARVAVTSPSGAGSMIGQNKGTYSRCWMQPDAFNILEDENKANNLRAKFPDGVRLVSYSGDVFLQAVPERMMDHWSWCPVLKGLGLYPFGAGDAALDIQARVNDTANTIHASMDTMAFGTILADSTAIDPDSMDGKKFIPGNFTFVDRTDEDNSAQRTPLSDLLFQFQAHLDAKIFDYEANLIQLAQAISGVLPQTFGGSDPNVQTASGQQQALHTATGRLLLYLKRIREERATRARNSVLCSVTNMDEQMKLVADGDVDGDWQTELVLKNEVTGDFITYPETDEAFPATFQEIQARIMELLTKGAQSPIVGAMLNDPELLKTVSRYVLPEELELPDDAELTRVKVIVHALWNAAPIQSVDQMSGKPVILPSILPSQDIDDMQICVQVAKTNLQKNWQQQKAKPQGFANVLAFLKMSAQFGAQQAAKAQLQQAQAQQQANGPSPNGPQQRAA